MRFVMLVFLGSCFSAPQPACQFLCGKDKSCPHDYACGADQRCHRMTSRGSNADCTDDLPADATIGDAPIDGSHAPDAGLVDSMTSDAN